MLAAPSLAPKTTTAVDCSPTASPPAYICDGFGNGAAGAAAVGAAGTGTISASGFTGGMQAGYNVQRNNWVYGLEADFGAFSLSGSRLFVGPLLGALTTAGPLTFGTSFSTDWLATVRGRLGWLFRPDLLAYVTGGLALTELQVAWTYSDNAFGGTPPNIGTGAASASKIKGGLAVGGGFEWAWDRNWSVKAEYLYLDFGKVTATGLVTNPNFGGTPYAQGVSTTADLTAHVARVGVNRHF